MAWKYSSKTSHKQILLPSKLLWQDGPAKMDCLLTNTSIYLLDKYLSLLQLTSPVWLSILHCCVSTPTKIWESMPYWFHWERRRKIQHVLMRCSLYQIPTTHKLLVLPNGTSLMYNNSAIHSPLAISYHASRWLTKKMSAQPSRAPSHSTAHQVCHSWCNQVKCKQVIPQSRPFQKTSSNRLIVVWIRCSYAYTQKVMWSYV